MKTAIYIEDGVTQISLTPETEFEKTVLEKAQDQSMTAAVYQGSFYECQGGWNRHGKSENSLMVRFTPKL